MKPSDDDIQHALNKAVQIMLKTTQVAFYEAILPHVQFFKFEVQKVVIRLPKLSIIA